MFLGFRACFFFRARISGYPDDVVVRTSGCASLVSLAVRALGQALSSLNLTTVFMTVTYSYYDREYYYCAALIIFWLV